MRKIVTKLYISFIEDNMTYKGSNTSVKIICESTEGFGIRLCLHQSLTLSPYLLYIVMKLRKKYMARYHDARYFMKSST